ncbi:hypothetical protein L1D32_07875 [Shewanella insulae]|uniref:hypothetical protein n=1 Tax=Shewanella insulae TaxID=2681496 RepID=UPI001EFE2853|nr:hypothetical protein [Shewanella insulae]MCG9738070.1 hypothetical protein [Shewanella insulae]
MASYLCAFTAPDEHINFLLNNPDHLFSYVEGELPELPKVKQSLLERLFGRPTQLSNRIPKNWPSSEVEMIGPVIHHRNVDLHHWILNGQQEFVSGSGTIFQTWLMNKQEADHAALDIGGDNENFAFLSSQIPELFDLVKKVNEKQVREVFSAWFKFNGKNEIPTNHECEEITNEYQMFAMKLAEGIESGKGLIWILC